MTRALVGLHVVLVLLLLAAAAGIWRLRCEGFGCMGVGVAWFAWVCAFCVASCVGLWARARLAAPGALARVCRAAWWLQLSLGAVLVLVWVRTTIVPA